jgi:hypothetical protein
MYMFSMAENAPNNYITEKGPSCESEWNCNGIASLLFNIYSQFNCASYAVIPDSNVSEDAGIAQDCCNV